MSRFVTALPFGLKTETAGKSKNKKTARNEYLERVAKYVPGEIIAAYMGLNALLVAFPPQIRAISFIICFLICWIFTPIYFNIIATSEDNVSIRYQRIVSFIAFLIWSYAIDGGNGIFGKIVLDIYYQPVGGALLILFSLVSGILIPRK